MRVERSRHPIGSKRGTTTRVQRPWSKEILHFDQVWVDEAIGKADRDAMWEKFGMPVLPNKTRDVILIR